MIERHWPSVESGDPRATASIRAICLALALAGCLLIIRGYTMGLSFGAADSPFELAGALISGAKYDLGLVGLLLGACLLPIWLVDLPDSARRLLVGSYISLVVVSLVLAVLNITFVKYLGGPLSYQWLYYSDFGMATDVRDAISSIVDEEILLRLVVGVIALVAVAAILTSTARRVLPRPIVLRCVLVVAVLAAGLAAWLARPYWSSYDSLQGEIANPVIYFVKSWMSKDDAPLLTMDTPVGTDDFRVVAERPATADSIHPVKRAGIRNVLLVVLESVGARYVDTYGGEFGVTPNISRVASRSIQFQDIYAHAPTSHKALVSILSSTYPLISYRTRTRETPDRKFDSVSAGLKKHGFRTGFFYSADLRYARVGEFLSRHSFDVVKDFRSIDCDLEFDPAAPEILRRHSTDDRCTARNAAD